MTVTTHGVDFERIVQEVVRRLRNDHARHAASKQPEGATSPEVRTNEPSATGTLVLADRVVSLATLEGRLHDVTQIRIARGAIITPAARDELRLRGVAVCHGTDKDRMFLWTGGPVRPWPCTIRSEFAGAHWIEQPDLQRATREVTQHVARGGGLAVVASHVPHVVACGANRHPGVRAAFVADELALGQAMETLAINTLVLDAVHCQPEAAIHWMRRFFGGAAGRTPAQDWLQ